MMAWIKNQVFAKLSTGLPLLGASLTSAQLANCQEEAEKDGIFAELGPHGLKADLELLLSTATEPFLHFSLSSSWSSWWILLIFNPFSTISLQSILPEALVISAQWWLLWDCVEEKVGIVWLGRGREIPVEDKMILGDSEYGCIASHQCSTLEQLRCALTATDIISIVADMGNCASVQKKAGPAMKFSCPIDSRGNCIHIESPVKGSSKVCGDHSMTEKFNSKPQSLSPKPCQASFHDMDVDPVNVEMECKRCPSLGCDLNFDERSWLHLGYWMKFLSAMKFVDLPLIIYLMMKMKRDVSAANNKSSNNTSVVLSILGNQEDMFFDSHPWIESDCEDYLSLDGDFTPSRGTTPIHQGSYIETPPREESLCIITSASSIAEPSPADMKKQLIELFRENISSDLANNNQSFQDKVNGKPIAAYLSPKCTSRSPYQSAESSVRSGETTPHRDSKSGKEKPTHSAHCCLPNVVRSLSFSERKRRLSHAYGGGQ
ncbi:hypothetical protein POTOM_037558 [Populus tomentosa]|uniref:Uncharacterized protein n=1 Tax=Populus tomentosa TaxID=118781 RepID=A0A8X8CCP0_POPTO|nr:hypothetical protein POTOM_037558 [Populus tomentosa]